MGCGQSEIDKEINKQLTYDKKNNSNVTKLLVIGAEGCGKSTFLKQLNFLNWHYNFEEQSKIKDYITKQIIEQLKLCLQYVEIQNKYDHTSLTQTEQYLISSNIINTANINRHLLIYGFVHNFYCGKIFPKQIMKMLYHFENNVNDEPFNNLDTLKTFKLTKQIVCAIKYLWNNDVIKSAVYQYQIPQITASSSYFWDEIQRISANDYVPTDKDILLSSFSVRNNEIRFEMGNKLLDFCEFPITISNTKWLQYFSSVNAIIFMVSLSCYNEQVLMKNGDIKNKMDYSIQLFDSVINYESIKNSKKSIFLFFTKKDLFVHKIKTIP
eukprot:470754_1